LAEVAGTPEAVDAGAVLAAVPVTEVDEAALFPVAVPVPTPVLGVVVVGVVGGNVVSGVGTGGSGFDNTLAIISFNPASD
jgi:hypothetical protein